jgi:hypothetical protein
MLPRPFVITGDFFEGAYGPTVLLTVPSTQAAIWLRQVFIDQEGRLTDRDLLSEPEVDVGHLAHLILTTSLSSNDIETKSRTSEEPLTVSILATRRGWPRIAELLDPFCQGVTGHQYFGDEEDDEVLFEITFGESEHA